MAQETEAKKVVQEIHLYADGGCHGNEQPDENLRYCGWGCILHLVEDEKVKKAKELTAAFKKGSNNIAELTAVIEGLKMVKDHAMPICVYTDSMYVHNGIVSWIHKWKANGWKTATKQPVANKALWQEFDKLREKFKHIRFEHMPGHVGHEYQERCHELTQDSIMKLRATEVPDDQSEEVTL